MKLQRVEAPNEDCRLPGKGEQHGGWVMTFLYMETFTWYLFIFFQAKLKMLLNAPERESYLIRSQQEDFFKSVEDFHQPL